MRETLEFTIDNAVEFKKKLLIWSGFQKPVLYLDNHSELGYGKQNFSFHSYDCLVATGSIESIKLKSGKAFSELRKFVDKTQDWLFGHLSYDLKNETENLSSKNTDNLCFPELHFFRPQLVFILKNNSISIQFLKSNISKEKVTAIYNEICNREITDSFAKKLNIELSERISKNEYFEKLEKILAHIKRGDIYEMNFCQEFFANNIEVNPMMLYSRLKQVSPTPFSSYYNFDNKYCLSASPERFMAKHGNKIISQPIKGTIRRGKNAEEDLLLKTQLENDPKERAENIMIVDLVRNDLSRTAAMGSVKVEELCGIYAFPQVYQMISSISSELDSKYHFVDAIKNAFPMGSMTGAPKIKSMELIEKYENSKRGIFSGAIGFIDSKGNFDFNVVIRSLQYNADNKYLSYTVGGAITNKSIAKNEYEECLLKAEAITRTLS